MNLTLQHWRNLTAELHQAMVVTKCQLLAKIASRERGDHQLEFDGQSLYRGPQQMFFRLCMYNHLTSEPSELSIK